MAYVASASAQNLSSCVPSAWLRVMCPVFMSSYCSTFSSSSRVLSYGMRRRFSTKRQWNNNAL